MPEVTLTTKDGTTHKFFATSREQQDEIVDRIESEVESGAKAFTYMLTRDGGRVLTANGKKLFVSPSMSTSNPEKINQIMQQEIAGGDTARQITEKELSKDIVEAQPFASRMSKVVEGIPFLGTYVDEAVSALGDDKTSEKIRTVQSAMGKDRPIESAALNVAGAFTGYPLAVASKTGTTLERAVKTGLGSGLLGALEGYVSGYGAGENDEQRQELAKERGMFGGATGGTLGFLSPYAGKVSGAITERLSSLGKDTVERISSTIKRTDAQNLAQNLGISNEAATIVKNAIDAGGTIEDAINNIRKAGQDGMIADANEATKTLLDAAMATGGKANVIGEQAVTGRLEESTRRTARAMNEVLGDAPMGRESMVEKIAKDTAPARSAAYGKAYQAEITYRNPNSQDLLNVLNRMPARIKAKVARMANERMAADPDVAAPNPILVGKDANGAPVFTEMPNVLQLDYMKRTLDTMAGNFTDSSAQTYGIFAKQLRDAIVKAVPEYGEALKLGASKIQMDEAFDLGYNMLTKKITRENVAKGMSDATPTEIRLAKTGARAFIDETLANVRSGITGSTEELGRARSLLRLLSDKASLDKLSQVLDTSELNQLMIALRELRSAFEMRAATTPGSRTAIRQDVQRGVEEMTEASPIRMAQQGNPIDATRRLTSILTGATDDLMERERQQIFAEIVQALTQKQGKDAQAALRYVEQAIKDGKISQDRAKFVSDTVQRAMLTSSTAPENTRGQ